jgi:hypothetical protein
MKVITPPTVIITTLFDELFYLFARTMISSALRRSLVYRFVVVFCSEETSTT